MIVQEKFVNKYKQEFYNGNFSIQKLNKQQRQLLKILEDLHSKTQKYFDKACYQAERKVQSNRTSFIKENTVKLPLLMAEAQLKNNQTYRQVLENQKNTLEKRMVVSMNLKQKDMNSQIKLERQKVINLLKNNKIDKQEIKKLGEKLIKQIKPYEELFDELLIEARARRVENQHKQKKMESIMAKTASLKQKICQLDYLIEQKIVQGQESQEMQPQNEEKLKIRINILEANKEKLRKNVESVRNRLSQEYYCKLKQLDALTKKGEQLDKEISLVQLKVDEKIKEMNKSKGSESLRFISVLFSSI